MQIQLSGQHIEITPALRQYVTEKLDRLARHFDHVGNVHVVLSVEKLRHKAEATIHLNRGTVFADIEADDMYAAIDALVDKLDRQVKKQKEKNTDYRNGVAKNNPA
jgi:putative sigma-54 modulation protein